MSDTPRTQTIQTGAPKTRSESTRLLTAEDLAERWQVSTDHVYRLAREGRLPVVQLGRYKRFTASAIETFEHGGGTSSADKAVYAGGDR